MITAAALADIETLHKLVNAAYRGDSSRKGWTTEADLLDGTRISENTLREIFNSNAVILKYEENNRLLGCVELRVENDKMYVGMLTVLPSEQSKGIGKKLLAAAERAAKEKNCQTLYMTVISERAELIAWYCRRGYRDSGKRKPFLIPDESFGKPLKELEFCVLEKRVE